MNVAVLLILVLLVAAYLAHPLMRAEPAVTKRKRVAPAYHGEFETSNSLLREINFDFERGTLSAEDRDEMLREIGRSGAVGSLYQGTRAPATSGAANIDPEDEIEREVARIRGTDIESAVERIRGGDIDADAAPTRDRMTKCRRCGKEIDMGAKFCASCGANTSSPKPKCARCGTPGTPGDKFCGQCGAPVRRVSK